MVTAPDEVFACRTWDRTPGRRTRTWCRRVRRAPGGAVDRPSDGEERW